MYLVEIFSFFILTLSKLFFELLLFAAVKKLQNGQNSCTL